MKGIVLDQGCPWSTATLLRNQGWDVVHVSEVGMSRATDEAILEWARSHNRICVTLDADFHTLLAIQGAKAPSTIRIRIEGLRSDRLAKLLLQELPKISEVLDQGAVVSITEKNVRLHMLPIE